MGEPSGFGFTGLERSIDGFRTQWADRHRYGKVAKIAIGIDCRGRLANNGSIFNVHRVCDHGRRRIGLRRGSGQDGDCIGYPQAETATAPAAGGDAAHGTVSHDLGSAVDGGC